MKDTHWIIKADCVGRQGWVGGTGVEMKGEIKTKKAVAKIPPLHKIVREKVNKGHIRGQSPKCGYLRVLGLQITVLKYFYVFKFFKMN